MSSSQLGSNRIVFICTSGSCFKMPTPPPTLAMRFPPDLPTPVHKPDPWATRSPYAIPEKGHVCIPLCWTLHHQDYVWWDDPDPPLFRVPLRGIRSRFFYNPISHSKSLVDALDDVRWEDIDWEEFRRELDEQNDDRKSKKNDTSPTERVRPIRPLPHRNLVDRALEDLRRQASDNPAPQSTRSRSSGRRTSSPATQSTSSRSSGRPEPGVQSFMDVSATGRLASRGHGDPLSPNPSLLLPPHGAPGLNNALNLPRTPSSSKPVADCLSSPLSSAPPSRVSSPLSSPPPSDSFCPLATHSPV
ncbi:hypothetical protein C8J57DRAFT_1717584 [Mycena rebaudengoi]|nr:hypothetical protein C8J57DRAFT_1717584 [Mycena rebaudengoi]